LLRSTAIDETGRPGSSPRSTRVQVGLSLNCASVLTCTRPSSEPVYTARPPPTPIAEIVQFRAPFGAAPVQPLVRSPLIAFH